MPSTPASHMTREARRQVWLGAGCFALMLCAMLIALQALTELRAQHRQLARGQALADRALGLQQQLTAFALHPLDLPSGSTPEALKQSAAAIALDDPAIGAAERRRLDAAIDAVAAARGRLTATVPGSEVKMLMRLPLDEAGQALRELVRAQTEALQRQNDAAGEFSAFARHLLIGAALLTVVLGLLLAVLGWRSMRTNRQMMGELDQLAHEDGLTGVLNRRALDERLPVEIARAERVGHALSAVMIDIDHFKRFNDRRGHGAGDELLRGAAQAWRRQLRPTDLLARYGGEEFTLVLSACDADQALQLIERLRPLVPEHQTFSAGVATRLAQEDAAELLRRADAALLQAKRGGRNRSVVAGVEAQMALPLRMA
ncbi:MAG: diguanylate cyclase [Betaproteobacteria bacterium]|nr:GGDEF domain-containing protein [Burkholderiales bacterium]